MTTINGSPTMETSNRVKASPRGTMKAAVFVAPGRIELQARPVSDIGPTDALLRVTTTTVCGSAMAS